jgi:hypothetical protein
MRAHFFPGWRFATTVIAALGLAACNEIPQDAPKPYAGKEDTKAYAGDLFKGDKAKYEKTLADRANYQNEYIRTGDAKQ